MVSDYFSDDVINVWADRIVRYHGVGGTPEEQVRMALRQAIGSMDTEFIQKLCGRLEKDLAAARERTAYLERIDAEQVDEFNAGYEAAERGESPSEPTDTKHDEWRIGYAFGMYPALMEHIRQLEGQQEWEPDWSAAPEWAQFHAINADGAGHWYEKEPKPDLTWDEWKARNLSRYTSDRDEPKDWRATLRRRPQVTE